MSAVVTLLNRFGGLFRFGMLNGRTSHYRNGTNNGKNASQPAAATAPAEPARAAQRDTVLTRTFGGRSQTDATLADISRTVDMLAAALAEQTSRLNVLEAAVERSAHVLNRLLEAQEAQAEILKRVAGEVSVTGRHAESLSSSLGDLPSAVRAAHDCVQDLGLQVRQSREAGDLHMQLTQRVMTAAETSRDLSAGQVERLQRMQSELRHEFEQTHVLMRRQNRRLAMAFSVAGLLALGGIASTLVLLFR